MKALSFKIPKTRDQSLRVQIDKQTYFYDSFHYHPEVQISYIIEGTGTRIIGNSVGRFNSDELYVIGPNIPHIFKSDKIYYEENTHLSHAVSFYFTEDAFGDKFFSLTETREISDLILNSKKILFCSGEEVKSLKKDFINITATKGFEKLRMFFDILHSISRLPNQVQLSKTTYEQRNTEKYGKRINDIFDFVIHNYDKNISLEKAAAKANLSTTAFCRFFKERTRKSFTEFVNEVRVGEACKLLADKDLNISQICYEVGFNNISNFNRKFKEIIGFTPKQYRAAFLSRS